MGINICGIIKDILVSTKSRALLDKLGKITFEVHKDANKVMIAEAVEKLWDVKVKQVNVVKVKGRNKRLGRKPFRTSDWKKAIVTLKEGYKIELPGQFESMGVPTESTGAEGK